MDWTGGWGNTMLRSPPRPFCDKRSIKFLPAEKKFSTAEKKSGHEINSAGEHLKFSWCFFS